MTLCFLKYLRTYLTLHLHLSRVILMPLDQIMVLEFQGYWLFGLCDNSGICIVFLSRWYSRAGSLERKISISKHIYPSSQFTINVEFVLN